MTSLQISCQVCYQAFGTLDNDRAPYTLSCSHVCCIGCLGVHRSSCPLCYMANDDAACRRMLNLRPDTSKITSPGLQNADRIRQLQDAISRVDEQTSLYRLRHLHEMANSFLETQPRNCCKDLESNVNLLRALLWAKEALIAQAGVVDDLTVRLEKIEDKNHRLRTKRKDGPALIREKDVWRHLRCNPEFSLLQDEMLHFRGEMNDLYAAVHDLRVPPPSIPSRPLPEPPSLSPPQFIPPLPILTPTPAYQEATTNHVKFQLPRYDETHDAPMPVAHSDGMLFLPPFPDDSVVDDYSASPLAVPPVYSSVLPDIGTWSREKEKDNSKWFASGVGVDPSLLGFLDARTHTGYVPLTQGDNTTFWPHFYGEDTASDNSSDAGQFLTGPIQVEDSELRGEEELHIHFIDTLSAHRAAELSPLGLSLVSSPEVRPRPPDDDELSDTGTSSTDEVESDPPRPRANRQISLSSSLTLLKTPKHHPRLDANYLQTRLHELLDHNLALGLGRHGVTSSLGFGLARTQTSIRIPNIDIDLQQNFSRTQSTPGGGLGPNPSRRLAGLNDESGLDVDMDAMLTPRHGPSKKKSRPNLKAKAKYNPKQLKAATSTPVLRIEGLPVATTPSPTVTSLTIARPVRNTRSRSDSEVFRSRIPRFAVPKSRTSDSDSLSEGGDAPTMSNTQNGAFSSGLMLDPNALAERFMEELQGCLVEVIARVFVQMLAELRVGASVSVAHGRKARGREVATMLDSGSEREEEEEEEQAWGQHGYESEDYQDEGAGGITGDDDPSVYGDPASPELIVGAECSP